MGAAFLVDGLVDLEVDFAADLEADFDAGLVDALLEGLATSALPAVLALRERGAWGDAGASAAIARTDLRISSLMVAVGGGEVVERGKGES